MRRLYPIIVAAAIAVVFFAYFNRPKNVSAPTSLNPLQESPAPAQPGNANPTPAFMSNTDTNSASNASNVKNTSGFSPPLARAAERVTKKKFGIFITPQNSPVQPEKFRGFHTGIDFEIFPEEADALVPVKAVCGGKLVLKKTASGYGGVAVESCQLDGKPITVIYGHLRLSSININAGDSISAGETVGILGKGYSSETDGERKHLHLGFHKGAAVNILGYVQNQSDLSNWIDPCLTVCND